MILICSILGAESGYLDAQSINNACYNGSITICDRLRMSIQYAPGLVGYICFLGILLFFGINNSKNWI